MNNETTYEFQSKCRVCLCQGANNVDIFEDDPKCGKISVALMECTSINIEVGDHLPTIICAECLQNLQKWFEFRLLCQMSDQTMRHYLNFITNDVAEPLLSATLEIKRDQDTITKGLNDTVESKENKSKKRKGKTKSLLTSESVDSLGLSSLQSPASNSSEEIPETESTQKPLDAASNNNFIIQASECQQFQVQTPNNGYQAFIAKATNSQGQIIDIPILIQLAPTTETSSNEQEKCQDEQKTVQLDDSPENTEVSIVPDVLGEFVCQTCQKTYKTERQLNRHETVVHGERRYGCEICLKKFTESSVLKLHKMAIHSAIRPYKCQFCEKSYTAKNHLRVHLRSHTGERPYKCQECHKLFSQKFLLNSHYKSVHANLRPFECNLCSKTFKRSNHLQNHIRIHKSSNQHKKPVAFECEDCLKQFNNVRLFRRHQLWYHKGAPPFICPVCNKKFVRKWDKQRHMKIHDHKRPAIKVTKSEAEAALKQIDSQDLKTIG